MSHTEAAIERLYARYRELEGPLSVNWSPDYGTLVVPNGNAATAVHRWFHLKEAYSGRLFARVLKECGLDGCRDLRVLDPFAGVGTTAVSVANAVLDGDLLRASVYGIECNPFLHLVAATKLQALQAPSNTFIKLAQKVSATVLQGKVLPPPAPTLSTFSQERFFDRPELRRLLCLKEAIRVEEEAGAIPLDIALAQICLGAAIETVSNLRRDGRALRHVEKRTQVGAVHAFLERAHEVDSDLLSQPVRIRGRVLHGDGRILEGLDCRFGQFDLVLFSPPYPNNIDYTEVYKLENWFLGFIHNSEEFYTQRLRTVYSHPSLLRPDPLPSAQLAPTENAVIQYAVAPLADAIPDDRYTAGRTRMLNGYALDMYLTLRSTFGRLRPGGDLVYVVGNSVHGKRPNELVIAADLLIASLAQAVGYEVRHLDVARHLRRRFVDSPFLRESVVFLRRAR